MNKIKLSTKKELEIYMNPVRQQLIRLLEISKLPMTPKMLADKLGISASGVQHHIKKLSSLGLIELDHTELINGITASFYKPTYVTVQIGLEHNDDSAPQRDILLQQQLSQTFEGFMAQKKKILNCNFTPDLVTPQRWGDIMNGVLHLSEQESDELMNLITEYINSHSKPSDERNPWEFALILYNAKEEIDD